MTEVTLVYAADERMAMPLAASIVSAVLNFRTPDAALNVVVIDGGLSRTSVSRLFPASLDPARFRFRAVAAPSICTHGIDLRRYGVAALYRLELPRLLPECRRAIYLDADTIVAHDLRELWDEACRRRARLGAAGLDVSSHVASLPACAVRRSRHAA